MKIGLLSVQNHNYGSILQSFALQYYLQKLGHNTEIICYKKTNYINQAKRLLYFPLLKATIKCKWKNFYCKYFKRDIYYKILVTREEAFTKFAKENFYYSRTYVGRKDLILGTKDYDCFVLSSDQVWNPMNIGGDFFTMTFVPDNIKKIAYAPSFGVSSIPNYQRKDTAKYLKRIDYISVREVDGVRIVYDLTGRIVEQVVDPTILAGLELWNEVKGETIIKDNYILCYFISTNYEYREFAKQLAKKTGYKLLVIPHVDEFVSADDGFGDIVPDYVGPLEFVSLIRGARYVCTDSFHASVFSVLFEITFFTFLRYSEESDDSTNSRLRSFLNMINMMDRFRTANDKVVESDLGVIDFSRAKTELQRRRELSVKYLKEALDGC